MNKYRLPQPAAPKVSPMTEAPENIADFVAKHRAEKMNQIKRRDQQVARQREALSAPADALKRRS